MSKLKTFIGNLASVLYFVFVMSWILLMLAIIPIMSFSDISVIRTSGFSTTNTAYAFIGVCGLFIGISLLVPGIRNMYYKLPWLFPYVKILYIDVTIMSLAITILNYGYEIQNNTRHMIFYVLMIVQIFLCRIVMCIYFNKKSVCLMGAINNEK